MNQALVQTGVPDLSFRHPMMEDAVGVFWDYQSCPHPEEYTGNTVIRGIRTLALASGIIKQFNVYVNLEPDPKDAQWAAVFADQVLREELHASGVSVLDCPTMSGNMIIVDILAFALQDHLPTTLVVISADPDLAYGVSLLRQRHFKAVQQRGWPLAEIQIKVASSPNMGWKKTETIAHLEEGVRLGLLIHTVRPQTNKRFERHYYAVEGTLKAKWLQGVPDPIGLLRAQTNLTVDAQEDASGPAGSSTHGIQGKMGARAMDPSLRSIRTTAARISNPRVSDVPDHLRDIINALVQADRSRGWPQEAIGYHLQRRDKKKWKDPEKVLVALEESVRVGLLVRSVGISKKNKNVKLYYAVEDGLKKSWLSIFGRTFPDILVKADSRAMSLFLSSATFPKESSKDGVVGIFWDYESCPSHNTRSIAEALEAIQSVAVASGSINSFNVYVDPDRHSKVWRAASLRQQLHNAGVSVIDCSRQAGKTVADKMMIVDLFAFALRARLPGGVVVISADPDLAYTLSLLRQRRFRVTLISSDTAPLSSGVAFGSQADARFIWNRSPTGQILSSVGNNYVPRIVASTSSPRPNDKPPPSTQPAVQASTVQPPPSGSPNVSQVSPTLQISPLSSSSSIPMADCRTSNPTATGPSSAMGKRNFTRASVPEHLHDLVTVLLKAVRPEGWPEMEIFDQLRHLNKTKWTNPGVVSTYLAEAVTLGIFIQSIALSYKNRRHTYYAVEGTLKKNWRS
ncbi:hypothetical protein M407DRAFT_8599 [Tulasnella calospora MUT 4182]|uniref:NYN domain-containing protein n=1 Tax=Tulasnella calospora MUT 4182 TaxID=1051891 RepID=A0A0C3KU71_9AGAM|nr:hypothetical protein M407DRAFT_8599 [Tulasnella calospora MUT 4182]